MPTSHLYSSELKHDDEEHWRECSCGERTNVENHTFGDWERYGEEMRKKTCAVCGATVTRPLPLYEKILDFIKDNPIIFVTCAVGVAAIVTITAAVKRKRRK